MAGKARKSAPAAPAGGMSVTPLALSAVACYTEGTGQCTPCHVLGGKAMKHSQEFPGPPEPSVNGHGNVTGAGPPEAPAQARRDGIDREATRYLSAATQVSIPYAEDVVSKVMNEPFRALAPTFGVDVPVVVKWALKALRTRAARDYVLLVIFALVVISAVPLFGHRA